MRRVINKIKIGLVLFLIGILPLYAAQQQNVFDGHILDKIELDTSNNSQVLKIEGTFSLELLQDIEIIPGEDLWSTVISFPNSLINELTIENKLKFDEKGILSTLDVKEDIQELANNSASSNVRLMVKSREPVIFELDKDATSTSALVFNVKERLQADNLDENDSGFEPPKTAVTTLPEENVVAQNNDQAQPSAGMIVQSDPKDPSTPIINQPKQTAHPVSPNDSPETELLHPVSAMLIYQRPSTLQISVLNASQDKKAAQRLAILVERHKRIELENRLGMKLIVSNISSVMEKVILPKTKVYFRPNYLQSAMAVADLIPGEQIVEQMPDERRGRLGVDIEIYVGQNF